MPELVTGSIAVSSSSSKSANSCSVHRNEFRLALDSTVLPTMAPSSTEKRWAPFMWTHPFNEDPSKRLIQPSADEAGEGTAAVGAVGRRTCGNAKAMMESPDLVAFLPLPPAAIAMYWRPSIM